MTNGGLVEVATEPDADGRTRATLTSIATSVEEVPDELLDEALRLLGWQPPSSTRRCRRRSGSPAPGT